MYASLHSPARARGRARSSSGSALLGDSAASSSSSSRRLAEGVETALRARWLRHCLPIIAQATHDAEGNALACVFADFQEDNTACEVNLVYWSEASWNRRDPLDLNSIGTFAYRTWNRAVYGRTADIKRLTFHDVALEFDFNADAMHAPAIHARCGSVGHSCPSCSAQSLAAATTTAASPLLLPWRTMTSPDFSFDQTFRHGDAVNICCFFAFYRHYYHSQPSEEWTLSQGYRPLLYLNTCNHMFGPEDKNPDLPRVYHDTYPVLQGGRPTAEIFGRRFVPNRPHLWAPCIWAHARLCASPSLSALSLPPRLCQAVGGALFACGSFARHAAAWALGTRSGAGADEEVAAASTLERRWTRHHHHHHHQHHHQHQQQEGKEDQLNSRRISVVVEEGPQEDSDAFVVEASTVLQCVDTDDDGEGEGDGDGDSEGNADADGPSGDSDQTLRDMETVAIGFPMDYLASPPRAGRVPAAQGHLSDVALAQTPPTIGQRRTGAVPPPISLASLPPTGAALAIGASDAALASSQSSALSSPPAVSTPVWPPPHLVPAFHASFLDWRRVQFAANGARRQTPAATPVAVRADAPHDTPPFFADLPRAVAFFTHAVWAQHELPPHAVRAGHPFFEAGRSGAIVWVDVTGVGASVARGGDPHAEVALAAVPASDPLKSAVRVIGPIAMHQTLALPGMHGGVASGKSVLH